MVKDNLMNIKLKVFAIFLVGLVAGITFFNICLGDQKKSFSADDLSDKFFIDSISVSKDFITVQLDKERGMKEAEGAFRNIYLSFETPSHSNENKIRQDEFKQTQKAQLRVGEGLKVAEEEFGYSMTINKIKDGEVWIKYVYNIQDYNVRPPLVKHDEYTVKIEGQYKRNAQKINIK